MLLTLSILAMLAMVQPMRRDHHFPALHQLWSAIAITVVNSYSELSHAVHAVIAAPQPAADSCAVRKSVVRTSAGEEDLVLQRGGRFFSRLKIPPGMQCWSRL